jgi:hypothetical protein
VDIVPSAVSAPLEAFRARDFSAGHCEILKKKLIATGSRNSKGVKLTIFNHALEAEWLKASPEEKTLMFTKGHDFHTRSMAQKKYAIGGDHTRSAVTDLHAEYPNVEKWNCFKGVTLLVSGESVECCSMLRDLGVMYNSKQYHKDMGFADRMLLTRKYYADTGMLTKGTRRDAAVIEWCEKQCTLAGIPSNSWSQYASCARVDDESWVYMEAILKGNFASKIQRGTYPATIPTTQSPFIQIMTCPAPIILQHLKQVYEGTLAISGLNNAAANYKAYSLAKEMIVWTVEMSTKQGTNEKTIKKTWPHLMSHEFVVNCVPAIKDLQKKQKKATKTDCPSWLQAKVVAQLRQQKPVRQWRFERLILFPCRLLARASCRLIVSPMP